MAELSKGRPTVDEGPPDPEELEASGRGSRSVISAATAMGAVHLTVSDLERSVAFYTQALGLGPLKRSKERASLGASSRELLVLVEERGIRPAVGFTGLYHFALLVPERVELARWLAHAFGDRVPLTGAADHFVSEALYLSDPDGHGIEIYWDRPRELWEGQVGSRMTTMPLNLEDLMGDLRDAASKPFGGLPAGTVMGHVHLKVARIAETIAFYRDTLGFGLMAQLGSQAAFLSAGGYHHHLGANTWESADAPAAPTGFARLIAAEIILPSQQELESARRRLTDDGSRPVPEGSTLTVLDPSGNNLVLKVG